MAPRAPRTTEGSPGPRRSPGGRPASSLPPGPACRTPGPLATAPGGSGTCPASQFALLTTSLSSSGRLCLGIPHARRLPSSVTHFRLCLAAQQWVLQGAGGGGQGASFSSLPLRRPVLSQKSARRHCQSDAHCRGPGVYRHAPAPPSASRTVCLPSAVEGLSPSRVHVSCGKWRLASISKFHKTKASPFLKNSCFDHIFRWRFPESELGEAHLTTRPSL